MFCVPYARASITSILYMAMKVKSLTIHQRYQADGILGNVKVSIGTLKTGDLVDRMC